MFDNYLGIVVCASKYFNAMEMRELFNKDVTHFGENRVQDLLAKQKDLNDLKITWHFIGHLQTNKVKDMINQIDVLHTLDRINLAESIQKHANKPVKCMIQVNLTNEDQKSGILPLNLEQFLIEIKKYDKIELIGLMTIGKDDDQVQTELAFKTLDELAKKYELPFRSMGMSNDYDLAIKHHATHLRIGRKFMELLD
ncbi:MAG: YggS family pyridoxal phosphate-dependent enzyme [Firmicutes bacterium]|nr:YggS family pyridoxal phosphate-dependent enzyme [Bacillota bacterium]